MLGFGVQEIRSDDKALPISSISENEDIEKDRLFELVTPRDLMEFGMIPEFVGRLPIICSVRSMDEAALYSVLTKPHSALVHQYTLLFEKDGVS